MTNTQNIDFSNISNTLLGMDYVIKPNTNLIKGLAEIRRVLENSRSKESVKIKSGGAEIALPKDLQNLLLLLAEHIEINGELHLAFVGDELTTQQAADYLDISRPSVIKLLEENDVKVKLVGRHRRITRKQLIFLEEILKKEKDWAIQGMIKAENLSRAEMRRLGES